MSRSDSFGGNLWELWALLPLQVTYVVGDGLKVLLCYVNVADDIDSNISDVLVAVATVVCIV